MNKVSPKILGSLLILIGLLPLFIYATRLRHLILPKATYTGIPARVEISPGDIPTAGGITTLPGSSEPVFLSSLAVDTGNTRLYSDVTYTWGISSADGLGDLIVRDNTAIATFIPNPNNPGIGDLWVTASTAMGQATSSVKICIGVSCPTEATPTPTPTPSCSRTQPTLSLAPNSQSGTPGEKLTYNISLINNDSLSCPVTHFEISSQVSSDWTGELSTTSVDLAPNHVFQSQLSVTSSPLDYNPGSKPVSIYAVSSNPPLSLQADAAYLLLTAGDLNKNGSVDIFDYNTLVAEFGKTSPSPADINLDGKIDIFDYNILVANFGK